MRTLLISLATAASALVVASPAAAQYYPYPPQPQGNAYGYYNNYGQIRRLQVRIDRLQQQINRLDRRDRVTEREARKLRAESVDIERRLRSAARNGLDPREVALLDRRIVRLEQHIARDVRDGRWVGRNGWGENSWRDRDHDGRNDRWEDDRGRHRD